MAETYASDVGTAPAQGWDRLQAARLKSRKLIIHLEENLKTIQLVEYDCRLGNGVSTKFNSQGRKEGTGPIPLPPEHTTQAKVKGFLFLGFEGTGHINLSAEMPARVQWESLLP